VDEPEVLCLGFGPRRGRDYRAETKSGHKSASWWLAAGDAGGAVTVWDLESMNLQFRGTANALRVFSVAFSPDGTLLAAGGQFALGLWNVRQGRQILRRSVGEHCMSLAFSPDANHLAATAYVMSNRPHDMARVDLLEIGNGSGVRPLRGLPGPIWRVAFSPDGKQFAAQSQSWEIGVWDRQTGMLRLILTPPPGISPDNVSIAFSPDGRQLAYSAGEDATLWDLATGRRLDWWHLPPGLIDTLGFGPFGQLRLFRHETRQGTKGPLRGVPFEQYPRVGRFRELLPGGKMRTVAEITRFNRRLLWADAPSDLSYVVVDGSAVDSTGEHESLALFHWAQEEPLWTIPRTSPDPGISSLLDPTGHLLAYRLNSSNPYTMLKLPEGTPCGSADSFSTCSPGAELLERDHASAALDRPCHAVFGRGYESALFAIGADSVSPVGQHFQFSGDGRTLVWSHQDGTIVLADLEQLDQQLARFGVGWSRQK